MKIFVAHSSNIDFRNELYTPLRKSLLNKEHDIFLPQEKGYQEITKEILKEYNLLIAEVSRPSTGEGIELGWANMFGIPIIYIHKENTRPSSALGKLSTTFIAYKNTQDMINKISGTLKSSNHGQ